jgi:hypothetical protein
MSSERLNSDIILDKTQDFLTTEEFEYLGELKSLKQEVDLLRNAVACLSNKIEISNDELEEGILGCNLRSLNNE